MLVLRCFGGCWGESVALEVRYKYPFHTLSDYVRILVLDSIFFLIVFHTFLILVWTLVTVTVYVGCREKTTFV
ncbi:hypothetical protein BMETH_308412161491, partial [methanotrophic bacterial endosymbiont of Bathymodiolus sp.]